MDLIQRVCASDLSAQNTCLDQFCQSANQTQLERQRDACHEAAEPETFDFAARRHQESRADYQRFIAQCPVSQHAAMMAKTLNDSRPRSTADSVNRKARSGTSNADRPANGCAECLRCVFGFVEDFNMVGPQAAQFFCLAFAPDDVECPEPGRVSKANDHTPERGTGGTPPGHDVRDGFGGELDPHE